MARYQSALKRKRTQEVALPPCRLEHDAAKKALAAAPLRRLPDSKREGPPITAPEILDRDRAAKCVKLPQHGKAPSKKCTSTRKQWMVSRCKLEGQQHSGTPFADAERRLRCNCTPATNAYCSLHGPFPLDLLTWPPAERTV